MDISLHQTRLSVRTSFDEERDLIQIFSGMKSENLDYNDPIDFRVAGLQRKGHGDIWHVDEALAVTTDEAAPVMLLDDWMGSNHGYSCAVRAYVPAHDKTYADIGSLWEDEAGIRWTLLRVEEDMLLFLSENVGVSEEDFCFESAIAGKLIFLEAGAHTTPIQILSQQGKVQLTRAIRHLRRELYYWKEEVKYKITGYHEDCERVELVEEYDIINPATVAESVRRSRPEGGYTGPVDLAVGMPCFRYHITFFVEQDGTVLCEFHHRVLQDIYWQKCFGIMYQEKCDLYQGGVWRYIPKLLPFQDRDGENYDFSVPYNTSGTKMPTSFFADKSTWEKQEFPPDRQIDFIRKPDGTCEVAFAGGYLPIYDGEPRKRKENIEEAVWLIRTRKTYPSFVSAPPYERPTEESPERQERKHKTCHGIAYKKYFVPGKNGTSCYTISHDAIKYVYMDFGSEKEMVREYGLTESEVAHVAERGGNLQWKEENKTLYVQGTKGYIVFTIIKKAC